MSAPSTQQNAISKLNNVLTAPAMMAAFKRCLLSSVGVDRYIQSVINTVAAKPELHHCTPKSIALAAVTAASLGLSVDATQEAYLVPYRDQCQFQIGYRGFIKLCVENGICADICAEVVHQNDQFEIVYGSNRSIKHIPNYSEPGAFVAVYAIAYLTSGISKFIVLPKSEVDRLRSRAKTDNAWKTDYEGMAKAKAIRQLCKTIPMSKLTIAAEVDARAEQGEAYGDVIDISIGEDPEPQQPASAATQPTIDIIAEPQTEAPPEAALVDQAAENRNYMLSTIRDLYAAMPEAKQLNIEMLGQEDLEFHFKDLQLKFKRQNKSK